MGRKFCRDGRKGVINYREREREREEIERGLY